MAAMRLGSAARELVAFSDARPATNSCKANTRALISLISPTCWICPSKVSAPRAGRNRGYLLQEGTGGPLKKVTRVEIMTERRAGKARTSRNVLASSEVAKRGCDVRKAVGGVSMGDAACAAPGNPRCCWAPAVGVTA